MAAGDTLKHKHYWEMRGRKRWSFGVWVTVYECKCGDDFQRLCGGRKK